MRLFCAFFFLRFRKFFYIWTVNWKVVSEEVFLSDELALTLLALTVCTLVFIGVFRWKPLLSRSLTSHGTVLKPIYF